MQSIKKLTLILPIALALSACHGKTIRGNGQIRTETRHLAPITGIATQGQYQVEFIQGKPQSVQIMADSNLLPDVITEVHNTDLSIHSKRGVEFEPSQPIVIKITAASLSYIRTSGETTLNASDLGGDSLTVHTSGMSALNLSGTVDSFELHASGNNRIDAKGLQANAVKLLISGDNTLSVYAKQALRIHASGSSTIHYLGAPSSVSQDLDGAVRIIAGS